MQLSERIKSCANHTPLIIMTASTNPMLHAELDDIEIADTLIKPITASALMATLVAHRYGTPTSPATQPQTRNPFSALDDALIAAHRSALGDSKFVALIAQYDTRMQSYLQELATAITKMDREHVIILAHKIAGLSASLGLSDVSALADQLDNVNDSFTFEALSTLHEQLVEANNRGISLIGSVVATPFHST